jgi:hypothetical protein
LVLENSDFEHRTFFPFRAREALSADRSATSIPDAAIRRNPEYIPDITPLWTSGEGGYAFTTNFLDSLAKHRELSAEDRKAIADNISRLDALEKYPFIGLELADTLEEERAAEIFVRTNSEGVTLKQADFILTLMSVFAEKLRLQLEEFSKGARHPSTSGPSPFNYFIKPAPDQLLRVAVGVAFFRGRLSHVYTMLRGKDMETGESSPQIRDRQFAQLAQAQDQVLDLTTWSGYQKALMAAGYASGDLISSENAILYSYALFILGKNRFAVDHSTLRRTIARWFFMSCLTRRYTNSPETAIEEDLAKLRNKTTAAEFLAVLDEETDAALTSDYWTITLPNELATSAARGPSLFSYYAALRILKAPPNGGWGQVVGGDLDLGALVALGVSQLRWSRRPVTTTLVPLASEVAAFSARVPQATTSKNEVDSRRFLALAVGPGAVDGDAEGGGGLASGGEAQLGFPSQRCRRW